MLIIISTNVRIFSCLGAKSKFRVTAAEFVMNELYIQHLIQQQHPYLMV